MSLRGRLETLHLISPSAGWSAATVSLVAAAPGSRIAVYSLIMSSAADGAFYFQTDTAVRLSGQLLLAANTPLILPQNENTDPWLITPPDRGLQMGGVTGGPLFGDIYYLMVPD